MSAVQNLAAALPQCARACLVIAVEDSNCAISNQTCICHNEDLNTQATACVTERCTVREALSTKNLTSTSCGISPTVDHSYVPVLMAFTAIAAVCVLLRVIARLKARVPVWWDDFIVALSFLGCVAFTAVTWSMKSHGLGTDIWAVPFDDITIIFKAMYSLFVLYITSRDLVRLSILLFYHRMFGHVPLARRLIQFSFVLIITCCIAFDLAIWFGCTPIDYFWRAWEGRGGGHCISTHGIFWAGAFITIAIDLWVMLVPIPFILRLNLSLRKKILSAIMFTFGIFVIAVSLYRLTTIDKFTLSHNPTADFVEVGIWSGLELDVGIICACLPNFHSLLKPVYMWMGTRTGHSRSGTSSGRGKYHRRLDDVEQPGPGNIIQTTTVVVVDDHSPKGGLIPPDGGGRGGNGRGGSTFSGIELGTNVKGTTGGRAWS